MCVQTETNHTCSHTTTDTFPCNAVLDEPSQPCPASSIQTPRDVSHPCASCVAAAAADAAAQEEDEHLADALHRINTDPTLAPHKGGPKRVGRAKTREVFQRCGHYARPILTIWERFEGDVEWWNLEMEGSCYGCCAAPPSVIQQLKHGGGWSADPWHEMSSAYDEARKIYVPIGKDGKIPREEQDLVELYKELDEAKEVATPTPSPRPLVGGHAHSAEEVQHMPGEYHQRDDVYDDDLYAVSEPETVIHVGPEGSENVRAGPAGPPVYDDGPEVVKDPLDMEIQVSDEQRRNIKLPMGVRVTARQLQKYRGRIRDVEEMQREGVHPAFR